MFSKGMSTRGIREAVRDLYGLEISAELVSKVTDSVLEEWREWQSRPLERCYPIVYLDAIHVKVREGGTVSVRAVYLALGVREDGCKEPLGLWVGEREGAKFWLGVLNQLKNRGVEDILVAVVDGLKGFPEALETAFPETVVYGLHRASAAVFAFLRLLERTPKAVGGTEEGLPGSRRGIRGVGAGGIRRERTRQALSGRGGKLAPELVAGDPLLWLLGAASEGDLHDERD